MPYFGWSWAQRPESLGGELGFACVCQYIYMYTSVACFGSLPVQIPRLLAILLAPLLRLCLGKWSRRPRLASLGRVFVRVGLLGGFFALNPLLGGPEASR